MGISFYKSIVADGAPKEQMINFPEAVIRGGEHVHVILAMPPSLTHDQLPSLLLFISQLKESAEKENKTLHITLHFYSEDPTTPVQVLRLDGQTVNDVLLPILEKHIAIENKKDPTEDKDKTPFAWKGIEPELKKESELQLDGIPRLLFLFSGDGNVQGLADVPADIVSVPFDPKKDVYPFSLTDVSVSDATRGLVSHFSAPSPCEAHKGFVALLNGFRESYGKRPLVKLFDSWEVRESFLLTNALRSLSEKKVSITDAGSCDSSFAYGTSQLYFRDGNGLYTALREEDCRGSYFNVSGCELMKGLLLFKGNQNALPADDETATITSGLYEFWNEQVQGGDRKAVAYFLKRVTSLLFSAVEARADGREGYSGAKLEETVPTYLAEMKATPSDLFAAIFGVAGGMNVDSFNHFLRQAFEIVFPYDTELYAQYIAKVFQPLIDNFEKMSNEERRAEISKIGGYFYTFMPDILDDYRTELLLPFIMALDIADRAIGDDKELKFNLGWMVVNAMTDVEPDVVMEKGGGVPIRYTINYLIKRGLLDSDMAVKLIEWTFRFKGLEEDDHIRITVELLIVWRALWPILTEADKEKLRGAFLEEGVGLIEKRVKWTSKNSHSGNDNIRIFGNYKDDKDLITLPQVMAEILNEDQMAEFVVRLLDNDLIRDRSVEESVAPSILVFHSKLDFDGWKRLVEKVIAKSEYAWKNIPQILKLTANEPRRAEILGAILKGLKQHNRFFSYFNADLDYTITVIEACVEEDIDDLLFWYASFYNNSYSEQRSGVDIILKGHFLTEPFKKKIITSILEMATTSYESESYRGFISDVLSHYELSTVMLDSYDDALHGDLWFDNFMFYMEKSKNGEADKKLSWVMGDTIYYFFPKVSLERKKMVVDAYLEQLTELHKEPFYLLLANFGLLIREIDSLDLMLATAPFFDIVVDTANAGELTYGPYSVLPHIDTFIQRWLYFMPQMPIETQAETFAMLAGPLAPFAVGDRSYQDDEGKIVTGTSFVQQALEIIIGSKKNGQDKERARSLGKNLTASPYISLLKRIFDPAYLDANGIQGLLKGFIETYYSSDAPQAKKADVEMFLQAGFFAFWQIDRKAFAAFLPQLLSKNIPDDLTWLALSPIRNSYLTMAKEAGDKLKEGTEGVDILVGIILDETIPEERRSYVWFCLKQISEDLAGSSWGEGLGKQLNKTMDDIRARAPWLKSLRAEMKAPTASAEE